ncbi:hypothetical protein Plhal304r1_c087g0169751 [Plasmopara halstedii]
MASTRQLSRSRLWHTAAHTALITYILVQRANDSSYGKPKFPVSWSQTGCSCNADYDSLTVTAEGNTATEKHTTNFN